MTVIAGGSAAAADASTPALAPSAKSSLPTAPLALGGAGDRLILLDAERLSGGVSVLPGQSLAGSEIPPRVGGYVAWTGAGYRLDAHLHPGSGGGLAAQLGATAGAMPGETGTSYGLKLGATTLGERFSINPSNRFGLVNGDAGNAFDMVVTVNHAFTPSISLSGTAEARRSNPSQPDIGGAGELLFGAGLGIRF